MNRTLSSRTMTRHGRCSERSGRFLAVLIGAAVAVNTQGLDSGRVGPVPCPPDVLAIQHAVAGTGLGGSAGTHGTGHAGLLEFQRWLVDTQPAEIPEEAQYDVAVQWATLPPPSRSDIRVPAAHVRLLEAALRCIDAEREGAAIPEPPPRPTAIRERYLFHLTANAPPGAARMRAFQD